MKLPLRLFAALALALAGHASAQELLKINGSTTVNLAAAEAAEQLRAEKGMKIQIDSQGGSSGGVSSCGDGLAQIGMLSKPLTDEDRAKYPKVNFVVTQVGADAVAMIVSKDVWDGGVRSLSRKQMQDIYEGRAKNWKDVGGHDQRIVFFNKEPGRGTWETFASWAYGNPKKAPEANFPEVGANEEARNKVATTRGAMSQLSASWADGKTVFALALRDDDGKIWESTPENIVSGKYGMARPLNLITNGEPTGAAKEFIAYMLGERGAVIMKKNGYMTPKELGLPGAK